jgi:hypothetical protein
MDTLWQWDKTDLFFVTPKSLETVYILGSIKDGYPSAVTSSINGNALIVVGDDKECCIRTAMEKHDAYDVIDDIDVSLYDATPVQWGAISHLFRTVYYKGKPRCIRGGADYTVSNLRCWPGGPLFPSPVEPAGYIAYNNKPYVSNGSVMYLTPDARDYAACMEIIRKSGECEFDWNEFEFVNTNLGEVVLLAMKHEVDTIFYRGADYDARDLAINMRLFAEVEMQDMTGDPEEALLSKIDEGKNK